MKLYAFHCGSERVRRALFDPFDADVGAEVVIPYFFYLIEHPRGLVLFDTGVHPHMRTAARDRMGAAGAAIDLQLTSEQSATRCLARLGLKPEDIALVAQSHLHFDHAGGIEFFPNATFLVQGTELPYANWPPAYYRGAYCRADFDHPVRWKELDGRHDVFHDGGLVLVPTPGHTPGHQSLVVALDERPVILVADAAFDPQKMRDRALPGQMWSPEAVLSSWDRLDDLQAEHDAELIFTHNVDFERETRLAPDRWYS